VDMLAHQFSRLGHEVVVLAPRPNDWRRLDIASVPYRVAWHLRFRSTRWFVAWHGRWLATLHRKHKFDVLHCHDIYPTGYVAACCAAAADVPLVITSHGGDLDATSVLARKPQLSSRYVFALKRAAAVIAVSSFTQRRFWEVLPQVRVERIPNGVDLARFDTAAARPVALSPTIRSGDYLLFLGRLERRKGVDVLLDAFRLIAGESDIKLAIAGQGAERSALEAQAQHLSLAGRVKFLGLVDGDIKTWLLQHALCTIVPSRISEAFAVVVLESYASGRPVIASRLPGLADLITPEQTGLLVPPESPEALAQALRAVLGRRDRLEEMGQQARRVAQDYDWQRIAGRHVALFEELIAEAARRRAV